MKFTCTRYNVIVAIGGIITAMLITLLGQGKPTAQKKLILFHVPDANHEAIVHVSNWYNKFLADTDTGLRFKPVQQFHTFLKMAENPNVSYAFLPLPAMKKMKHLQIQPLLVPAKQGDVYYRKLLIDRGQTIPCNLTNKTIAATIAGGNFKEQSKKMKQRLRDARIPHDKVRFLKVPKDIDALLALAFKRVDAAEVTPSSVVMLHKINPQDAQQFRVVTETQKRLRAPLCRIGKPDESADQRIIKIFQKMHEHKTGRRAMKSLAIDSWVPFDSKMYLGEEELR